MWIADNWKDYELLDASNGERLERWGQHILVRPDPQVIWKTPRVARLETPGGTLQPQPYRRRLVGQRRASGELGHPLRLAHLPCETHELQAHRSLPRTGGELGLDAEKNP